MVRRNFSFIVHMYEEKHVAELSEFALFSRKINGYYLDIHTNVDMAGCKIRISDDNRDEMAVALFRHIRKNERDRDAVFVKMF